MEKLDILVVHQTRHGLIPFQLLLGWEVSWGLQPQAHGNMESLLVSYL